jgi:hypothetical protein
MVPRRVDRHSLWAVIGGGEPVRDGTLARGAQISYRTASRWRRKLEFAGLLRRERVAGGYRLWLRRLDSFDPDLAASLAERGRGNGHPILATLQHGAIARKLVNTDEEFFARHARIGKAAWLLMAYWHLQEHVSAWSPVAEARTIRDRDTAAALKVSVFTAARYREQLTDAGAIQVVRRPGGYRVYAYRPPFATNIEPRMFKGNHTPPPVDENDWPEFVTNTVQ